jgi:RHH-type proline utilization regulon transcriptional repressor/proline dehydrogenase/delta 1-pyrroline-5-carboxylate dehydrogenase
MPRAAGIGISIDAEEADRLDLSLDVIEAVPATPACRLGRVRRGRAGLWPARGRRDRLARTRWPNALDRRIMVRLVKGAYWDTEIKRAQVEGLPASRSSRARPRPMSPTSPARASCWHDRPDLPAIRHPQRPHHGRDPGDGGRRRDGFEFQRLHGMGEALHRDGAREEHGTPAASMRPWARIATCWPIWCGGCWKTAPTLLRQPDRRRDPRPRSRAIRSPRWSAPQPHAGRRAPAGAVRAGAAQFARLRPA